MADPNNVFSEYIRSRQTNDMGFRPTFGATPGVPAEGSNRGWLGSLVDVLQIGVYPGTRQLNEILDLPDKIDNIRTKGESGDVTGAIADSFKAVGDVYVKPFTEVGQIGARLAGRETDPEAGKTYEAVIEKATDVANRNNPDYVDVTNNANTWFKGGLGLALDIGLDPLTYATFGGAAAAKMAARGTKAAAKAGEELVDAANKIPTPTEAIARGLPEAAALPSVSAAERLNIPGTTVPRTTPKVTKNEGVDNFPSATVAESINKTISDDVLNSKSVLDAVNESIGKTIGAKIVDVPGVGKTNLRGGISQFLDFLKKAAPVGKAGVKPVSTPSAFFKLLEKDLAEFPTAVRVDRIIPGYKAGNVITNTNVTLKGTVPAVVQQYKRLLAVDTPTAATARRYIEENIFAPMMVKYNGMAKAGKNVTAFGTPRTAADAIAETTQATAAEMVATNLRRLSDASKARGVALFGEDLFNFISNMQANDLAPVLDDLDTILRSDGAIADIAPLLQGDVSSRFLQLFDVDNAMYSAAKLDVARRLDDVIDGVEPKTLEQTLDTVGDSPVTANQISENLAVFGMAPGRFKFLAEDNNAEEVFNIVNSGVEAGANAAKINFSEDIRKSRGFTTFTDEGVPRNDKIFGEGEGVLPNQIASYGQMNYILAISKRITDRLMKMPFFTKGTYPTQRASIKEATVLAGVKTLENSLEAAGVPIKMDIKLTEGGAVITKNLKFSQAYSELAKNGDIRTLLRLNFFNPKTGLPFTKFMDAVMTSLAGGTRDDVLAMLRSTERRNRVRVFDAATKETYTTPRYIPNWLSDPKASAKFGRGTYNAGKVAEDLADAIVAATPALDDIARVNAKAYAMRGVAEGEAIAANTGEIVMKLLNDPTKVAEAGMTIAKSGTLAKDVIETVGNVTPLGATIGNARTTLGLGKNLKASAKATVDTAEAVGKRDPKAVSKAQSEANKVDDQILQSADRAAVEAVQDVLAGRRVIRDQRVMDEVMAEAADHAADGLKAVMSGGYASMKTGLVRGLNFLGSFFNVNKNMNTEQLLYISRMYHGQENIHHALARELFEPIAQIGKKAEYNGYIGGGQTTILQEAFNAIREGRQAAGIAAKAQAELLPFVSKFFGTGNNVNTSLMANVVLRGGANLDRVNQVLAGKRVLETTADSVVRTPDEYFDLGAVFEKLGDNAKPEDVLNELAEQWKTWDVRDPILFLDRMVRATSQLISEVGYVSKMLDESVALGLASRTPKPGLVPFAAKSDVTLSAHINGEWYVEPEVAAVFGEISRHMDEIAKVGSSKIERQIDEFTDAFKYGATQARLGHHTRNFVGGASMTAIAQGIVHYGKAFEESLRITRKINKDGAIDDMDLIAMLTRLDAPLRTSIRNADETTRVVYKGSKGKVTEGDLISAIDRYGVDPSVAVAESFAEMGTAAGGVAKVTQKFLTFASLGLAARGGRAEKFWTRISQGQDHINRNHMFIQYVMQALDGKPMPRGFGTIKFDFKKPDVMEDIYTYAAERVAKYHPTIQGLTAAERRSARRLFPFYSWNKGAVIALTEGIVMYPSRVSWPFKASYNLGVATGVDPNSYYDPFPTDQRFPSYMTEDINGPQFVVNGKYYGFQPGFVQFDVLNQFGASDSVISPVYEAAVNSLNPGVKLPIELITQSRLSTRSPIADVSDYVDSSIPNVTYYVNASTYSPSSVIIDGELQQNKKYEAGDKTNLSRILSLANWATGFGIYEGSRRDLKALAKTEENVRQAEEREQRNK